MSDLVHQATQLYYQEVRIKNIINVGSNEGNKRVIMLLVKDVERVSRERLVLIFMCKKGVNSIWH